LAAQLKRRVVVRAVAERRLVVVSTTAVFAARVVVGAGVAKAEWPLPLLHQSTDAPPPLHYSFGTAIFTRFFRRRKRLEQGHARHRPLVELPCAAAAASPRSESFQVSRAVTAAPIAAFEVAASVRLAAVCNKVAAGICRLQVHWSNR
jgi:hypothetical protein